MPQDYLGVFLVWQPSRGLCHGLDRACFVCVLTACTCEHPSVSALRCAYGDGGPFFRGCSTGHLPRTALGRSCLDVPALSSVKRPIFLSSAPSRWAGCLRHANWERPARGCCFWAVDTSTRRSGFHFPGNVPASTCGQPGLHESHSRLCLGCCGVPCPAWVYISACVKAAIHDYLPIGRWPSVM